ncbi:MAG: NUDIX domain-containing protein [Candidatus Entotheonellia bacterium]
MNAAPEAGGIERFRPAIYGVLIQDGQVLLVRAPQAFLGVVGFPGGGIELGEAPLDALRREFTEETGLEVEPMHLLWATTELHRARLKPAQQLIAIHWEVRQVGGTLRPQGNGDDVEIAFFCPLPALPVEEMLGVDLELVPRLLELSGR